MDYSIFEQIRTGDRRKARMWACALYTSLKDVLTGDVYSNPTFVREFLNLSDGEQNEYVREAVVVLRYIEGFDNHARKLETFGKNYFQPK